MNIGYLLELHRCHIFPSQTIGNVRQNISELQIGQYLALPNMAPLLTRHGNMPKLSIQCLCMSIICAFLFSLFPLCFISLNIGVILKGLFYKYKHDLLAIFSQNQVLLLAGAVFLFG